MRATAECKHRFWHSLIHWKSALEIEGPAETNVLCAAASNLEAVVRIGESRLFLLENERDNETIKVEPFYLLLLLFSFRGKRRKKKDTKKT